MIHLFPTFGLDADQSPLGNSLRQTGVKYKIFASSVSLRYKSKIGMLLLGHPKLLVAAFAVALRSMFSEETPDAVLLTSDIAVLVFAFLRTFSRSWQPKIVFLSFIYTERNSIIKSRLRLLYYRFVMKRIDCAIGHSRLEVERYRRIFPGKTSFSFIPWGGNVNGSDAYAARSDRREEAAVVSLLAAGRSGRDYGTLVRAIKDLHNVSLTIVCDQSEPLKDIKETDQVTILRHCYGFAYLEQIEKASIVIVPLMVEDISAGQMVLIQAMAYGKPIIVTRAATVLDYVEDQKEALLVDRGDVNQMRTAIETLLANPAMRLSLGRAGRQAYETRFNQTAMTNNTLKAVQQLSKAA